ncbi:Fe-S cluster assembly scaffold SufA [Ensifer soli]|uniref:Fe-S cluster assembly scaffold SufA n=1 Tax=Ciceribacter sp. sgz301302 TaxID=3342379 RepID=UPI0035BAF16D
MGFAVMSLTDAAAGRVKAIVENAGEAARGIRVSIKKGGCAGMEYAVDLVTDANVNARDDLVEHAGAKVWVAPEAVLYLLGTRMDFEATRLRSGFTFTNPNQTSACGCGESVELKPADLAALAARGDAVVRAG